MTSRVLRCSAILFLLVVLALSSRMGARSGHELFQQALSKERAEGQPQEAIRLYERVVAEFPSDRALTAGALVQLETWVIENPLALAGVPDAGARR